jgi:hypothetical protein
MSLFRRGKAALLKIIPSGADPAVDPDAVQVYAKDAGGGAGFQLFAEDANGAVYQLTPPSSDGAAQRFQYIVTGTEPDLTELVIPLPAVRAAATYLVFPAQEDCANQLGMNVATASKLVNQFTLSLSASATIGDVFSFAVVDPT